MLEGWGAAAWPGLTAGERKLMGGATAPTMAIYADISPAEREIIRHWVWEMADGMRFLEDPA